MNTAKQILWSSAIATGLAAGTCPIAGGQIASFSGAMGFGAIATGGRTGTVYHVTNLNDTGAGSFRDAVSASNRIIVFDVGGYIHIATPVTAQSNLTILGQTAPGQGIGIYGAEVSFFGRTNDVVRYMRFRDTTQDPGGQGTGNSSGNDINLGNSSNMMFDHVSAEFASYNNIDAAGTGADNLTFQNSMIANPITSQQFNFHWEGSQGTFINNLFVDAHNRSVLAKGNIQYVNNTVYNYQAAFTANSGGQFQYDILNNYFITGPSTTSAGNDFYQISTTQSAYASGNILDSNRDGVLNGSTDNGVGATVLAAPWSATTASLPLLSTAASYAYNVTHAGDSLTHDATTFAVSSGYDAVDAQVSSNVQTLGSAGRMWSSETQTGLSNGGLGTIAGGAKPTDTDNDGIPDAYEIAHGLNPAVADSTKLNPVGYTMIEQYANELADATAQVRIWTSNGSEWNTAGKWTSATPGTYDIASVQGLGAGTDGLVTVSSATPVAYQLLIGGNGAAAGEKVQVISGSLDVVDKIQIGNTNTGTLQIDGGVVQAGAVIVGNTLSGTTYTGSLVLNGGTLQTTIVALGGGSPGTWTTGGNVTFNGGTLQALGNLTMNVPASISAGGGKIDTNGFSATLPAAITGSGALTKLGAGVLTLTANNTFSGGTNLTSGEVGITTDANIGGSASIINFTGGSLQINGTSLTNLNTHSVNWSSFDGGIDVANSANTFTVSQTLGGSGAFNKSGAGTLVLSGNSTFTGGVSLNGGVLSVSADANLGANGNPLSFSSGTLRIVGTTLTNTLNHPLTSFNGGTFDINTAGNVFTINQQVNGSGTLTKVGPGTLVLGTRDYFTGDTYLNAGTLRVGDPLSLRYTTVHLATAGTTLDLNGINETIGGLTGNQTFDIKGTSVYVGNNGTAQTFSGVLADSIGTGSVHKIGGGTWTLSGTNTFTGPLVISAGAIGITTITDGTVAGPLGASSSAAANLVMDGGTLAFTGTAGDSSNHLFTLTVNGGTFDGSGASGSGFGLTNTGAVAFTGTGNRTLNLIGSETHNSFYPALGDADAASKTSLVVNGAGRWLWQSKLSTYSGDTTILAGTLRLYSGGILPSGLGKGNVVIDAGGFFVADISTTVNALVDGTTGPGGVTISSGTLSVGAGDANGSFTGVISGSAIAKIGLGTQILGGTNTYIGTTTVTGGVLQFNSLSSIGGTGASVSIATGSAAAAGYAIDQTFLGRINPASTGSAALALSSANNLNFSATGANFPNVSLGAVGAATYSGVLTPYAATYRLGGGGGTLTLPNAGQLSGSTNLVVSGPGSVVATGANTYTATTTVLAGATFAPLVYNGGIASGMGMSSNSAANLMLDGGTFRGIGTTDRSFTLTTNGGTLDNSAGLSLTGPGAVALPTAGNVTLTLTGTSTAHNLFNLSLGNGSATAVTSVLKTGAGKWTFSADGTKTYTGDTHIAAGTLEALSGDAFSHFSSLVIDAGASLDLHSNNATVDGLSGIGAIYNSFTSGTHTLTIGAGNDGGVWAGNINSGATLNVVKAGSASETFTAANTYVGTTTVTGGNLILTATGSLTSNAIVVSSSAGFNLAGGVPSTAAISTSGLVNIASSSATGIASKILGAMTITSGGKVILADPAVHANRTLLTVANLTFGGASNAWQGQLDLGQNDLIVQSGNLASLTNQLRQGYAATGPQVWNGSGGIVSSTAASSPTHLTAIGVVQNSVDGTTTGAPLYGASAALGTFDGSSPASADVLLKYTYYGDANLDGRVDGTDYARIDFGYLNAATGWYNGDFNYDGVVNGSDYTLLDNAYNTQASSLTSNIAVVASQLSGATAVPEPGAIGLAGLAGLRLLARRRRRLA